jgi:hypothetical protein
MKAKRSKWRKINEPLGNQALPSSYPDEIKRQRGDSSSVSIRSETVTSHVNVPGPPAVCKGGDIGVAADGNRIGVIRVHADNGFDLKPLSKHLRNSVKACTDCA